MVVEAQINGIPCIVSDRGGLPEAVGDGGDVINFSDEYYQLPYNKIPNNIKLTEVKNLIAKYFDNAEFYERKSSAAITNTQRFRPDVVFQNIEVRLASLLSGAPKQAIV